MTPLWHQPRSLQELGLGGSQTWMADGTPSEKTSGGSGSDRHRPAARRAAVHATAQASRTSSAAYLRLSARATASATTWSAVSGRRRAGGILTPIVGSWVGVVLRPRPGSVGAAGRAGPPGRVPPVGGGPRTRCAAAGSSLWRGPAAGPPAPPSWLAGHRLAPPAGNCRRRP